MKNFLVGLIFTSLLLSCKTIKTIAIIKGGEVVKEEFVETISFETRLGLIIIKVEIENQEYDFLLDTGSPTIISTRFASQLKLDNLVKQTATDSEENSSNLSFSKLKSLSIGSVPFANIGVAITDLENNSEISCLEIDGIIGANLMNKLNWRVNFEAKEIILTDDINKLNVPVSRKKINFKKQITGSPFTDILFADGKIENVVLDLGSNGGMSLSKESLIEAKIALSEFFAFYKVGNSSVGLYGTGTIDTSYYYKIADISFGELNVPSQIIKVTNDDVSTIGLELLKNFDIVFNWSVNEMYLIERKIIEKTAIETFGFSFGLIDNLLIVNEVYMGMNELQLGDQIIQIGNDSFDNMSQSKYCELLEKDLLNPNRNKISIKVLRGVEIIEHELNSLNF